MSPQPKMSAAERLQIVQNQANLPVTCEKCGSVWFTDTSFNQYSASRYSTTPGGDLNVISSIVQRIRVCICGHPVSPNIGGIRPGRTASTEVNSFLDSFRKAAAYLNSIGKLDLTGIAGDFVTRAEYEKLVAQVSTPEAETEQDKKLATLQAEVAELKKQVATAPAPAAPATPTAAAAPAAQPAENKPVNGSNGKFQKKGNNAE